MKQSGVWVGFDFSAAGAAHGFPKLLGKIQKGWEVMCGRSPAPFTAFCVMATLLGFNSCAATHPSKTVTPPPEQTKVQGPESKAPPKDDGQRTAGVEPGKPIERELKGGESHSYPLRLKANDYLNLVVEQKGIDVVVRLLGPDGKKLLEVDSPNGDQGPEPLSYIAEQEGGYTLEIEALEKTAGPGKYELQLAPLRPATDQDRAISEVAKLNTEAEGLRQQRKYDEGRKIAQAAADKAERMLGPDHPSLAQCLYTLAQINTSQSKWALAVPLLQRVLAIHEKTLGPNHPTVATVLDDLAQAYQNQSDSAKAEPLYQRALAIREKMLGPDHPETANSLNNLAVLYESKGDFAKVEPMHLRALAIREKVYGPEHLMVGNSLNNLAGYYVNIHDYAKAEPLFLRFLALMEKLQGPDSPYVALACNNLATVYNAQKDYPKLEPLYRRSLAIWEKKYGPNNYFTGLAITNLAGTYFLLGDYAKAEPLYLRSLAVFEKVLSPDNNWIAGNLNDLANLYQAKGDPLQAISYRSRCNEAYERDLQRNLIAGSEREKLLYLNRTGTATDNTISLHLKLAADNSDAQHLALTVVLRRKGRALDAMTTAIETLRRRQNPETQKLLDDYAKLVSRISEMTVKGPGNKKPEEQLALVRSLEEQKEQLENDISRLSAEFKAQTAPITLEAVQSRIPPNAVLAEYVVYRPFEPKSRTLGNPCYAVYLLNSRGEIRFADLGEAQPIEAAVDAFRKAIRNQKSADTKAPQNPGTPRQEGQPNVRELGRKLEQLVFQPVRNLLGKTSRVLLSPDGVLNLVPFNALVDEKGNYLVQSYEFSYLTSGRDLLRLQTGIKSESPPLVIANPDYSEGNGPKILGQQFSPLNHLPGTELEARQLKAAFPDALVYLGSGATKKVLATAQRPEFLHIGTHGYFLPDVPPEPVSETESSRMLTRAEVSANEEKTKQRSGLLRSYLFFVGANQADGNTEEGGVMTALEATGLNLWGTKLVVLSACDTGLGDVKNGDGVYGLRRALVLAGSEAQMMSLWPVSDVGTGELMIQYYRRLKAGEGRSAALRNVQLEMLKSPKRRHPYFWAGFIQSGEWANLDGRR